MLIENYDFQLVLLSLFVAVLASYTALDMAGRIHHSSGGAPRWWLAGGAVAMGMGVWSMHFIGMLAFRLPIDIGYDTQLTLLSLLLAIGASAFALWKTSGPTLPLKQLVPSALVMGAGIAGMHYVGMASMRMQPGIRYDPTLFALSLVIAVLASGAALKIAHVLRVRTHHLLKMRMAAALVMGLAIVGMHYTGMAAAQFDAGSVCMTAKHGLPPHLIGLMVFVVTLSVLGIALITSVLDARLESHMGRLAQSLARANAQLSTQALHDGLTGLPNRTLLEDRLRQALAKAARETSQFAVMFLDLDGFKSINDSLGHHVGDLLLIEVAARIKQITRSSDTVARLGGDEFVVLVEVLTPEGAAMVAEKLLRLIEQPILTLEQTLSVSTSIGIAVYPTDGTTPHQLMLNADAAMYHTKNAGRNGYHFFEPSMNTNAHLQLELMQDLRNGLERNEFFLMYQPKVQSAGGKLLGVEALIRWCHPTRGTIDPDDFIGLAERSGLIVPIGEWVIREACHQLRRWHDAGCADWTMAVNLSALQFVNAALIDVVRDSLSVHGLAPHFLTLEITESVAMKDVELSQDILDRLAALGVKISIDDFGTGYSSLLYLKRFPASEIKIDRAFVQNLSGGTDDAAIVDAIVSLARSLDLTVVAEGVETQQQYDFLAALGCQAMQGYLMARPMLAADFPPPGNAGPAAEPH